MAPPLLWAWLVLVQAVGGAVGGACTGKRWSLKGSGALSDGAGNYSVMGECIWVLHATPGQRVLLTLTEVETECGFDFLFVFDGPAPRGRLLAALSGNAPPPPLLEAASGQMLVQLFSDANYNLGGFSGHFRSSRCPGGCRGRGRCDPQGLCHCQPGWGGPDCGRAHCPDGCPHPGVCNQGTGRCECPPGFVGRSCQVDVWGFGGGGRWHPISDGDDVFGVRVGAAGVVLPHTGGFYVFGGQALGAPLGDLVMFNFSTNSWSRILQRPAPAARHSHTACRWRDAMVVFGGELRGGALARDVWLYRPQRGWTELQPRRPPLGPPRAAHGAAVVGEWLYVSGGRSDADAVSALLFRFHLGSAFWERVEPWGGRAPAAAGHSCIWDPWGRSLVLHGGVRPSSARFSSRTNSTDLYHVTRRHWSSLRFRDGASGAAPPTGFHSAERIGRYMVLFGGSVHQHYQQERCYGDGIFFYHLGCHQWVPGPTLTPGADFPPPPGGGRVAHVSAVLGGRLLLVVGGFSGVARGDLIAFKVPGSVLEDVPQGHPDPCSAHPQRSPCSADPQCSWCQGGCRRPPPGGGCPPPRCAALPRLLSDCSSCLVFSAPRGRRGAFGWCVQNDTCLPLDEASRCHMGRVGGTHGWWGPQAQLLTSLEQCKEQDIPPGLHLLTFLTPRNDSQPDKVTIVRSSTVTLTPPGGGEVWLQYLGFLHPLLGAPQDPKTPPAHGNPPTPTPQVWARIRRLRDVVAKVGRGPGEPEMEEVGRWAAPQERQTRPLVRGGGRALLSPPRGRYALQVEGRSGGEPQDDLGFSNGGSSELTLVWDRTGVPGGSEISFFFLEPHRTSGSLAPPGGCSRLPSCGRCLADLSCAWCPPSSSCVSRSAPGGEGLCGGGRRGEEGPRLVLRPNECPACEEHVECGQCAADPFCEWQPTPRPGDFVCSRRGRMDGAVRDPSGCPLICSRWAGVMGSCGVIGVIGGHVVIGVIEVVWGHGVVRGHRGLLVVMGS